jgi:hypothetical protein
MCNKAMEQDAAAEANGMMSAFETVAAAKQKEGDTATRLISEFKARQAEGRKLPNPMPAGVILTGDEASELTGQQLTGFWFTKGRKKATSVGCRHETLAGCAENAAMSLWWSNGLAAARRADRERNRQMALKQPAGRR